MTQTTAPAALPAELVALAALLDAGIEIVDVVDIEIAEDGDACPSGHPLFDNGECAHFC